MIENCIRERVKVLDFGIKLIIVILKKGYHIETNSQKQSLMEYVAIVATNFRDFALEYYFNEFTSNKAKASAEFRLAQI